MQEGDRVGKVNNFFDFIKVKKACDIFLKKAS